MRALSRLEVVGEIFRAALNGLAAAAPVWLTEQIQVDWIERYEHRIEDDRLPDGNQACEAYALVMGQNGIALLDAIYAPTVPACVRHLPAVQILRRVWLQQFYWGKGELRWCSLANMSAVGDCINSPYDPEAQYAKKRDNG